MSCVGICFDSLSMTRRSNSLFVQVFKCRCVWHLREFLNKIHKLHINNSSGMVFLWSTLQQSKASLYLNLKRFAIKLPVHGARHSKRWGGGARSNCHAPNWSAVKKRIFYRPKAHQRSSFTLCRPQFQREEVWRPKCSCTLLSMTWSYLGISVRLSYGPVMPGVRRSLRFSYAGREDVCSVVRLRRL